MRFISLLFAMLAVGCGSGDPAATPADNPLLILSGMPVDPSLPLEPQADKMVAEVLVVEARHRASSGRPEMTESERAGATAEARPFVLSAIRGAVRLSNVCDAVARELQIPIETLRKRVKASMSTDLDGADYIQAVVALVDASDEFIRTQYIDAAAKVLAAETKERNRNK